MTTIGYGDFPAYKESERIFAIFAMVSGGICFTYGLTRVVHIVSGMGRNEQNMMETLDGVKEWSDYHHLPVKLVDEVTSYYRYKHRNMYTDESALLESLSLPLRRKVVRVIYDTFLKRIDFFKGCNEQFLIDVKSFFHFCGSFFFGGEIKGL